MRHIYWSIPLDKNVLLVISQNLTNHLVILETLAGLIRARFSVSAHCRCEPDYGAPCKRTHVTIAYHIGAVPQFNHGLKNCGGLSRFANKINCRHSVAAHAALLSPYKIVYQNRSHLNEVIWLSTFPAGWWWHAIQYEVHRVEFRTRWRTVVLNIN